MARVVVLHRGYGCDTGCCGHCVQIDGEEVSFDFTHPNGKATREFIRELVTDAAGEEHVADIDWDNCIVSDA